MFFYAVVYGSTTRLFGSTYDIEYKSNGTLETVRNLSEKISIGFRLMENAYLTLSI